MRRVREVGKRGFGMAKKTKPVKGFWDWLLGGGWTGTGGVG